MFKYWACNSGPWHRAPETHNLWVTEASLVLMRQLSVRAGHPKHQPMIRRLDFQPCPTNVLRREKALKMEWLIKPPLNPKSTESRELRGWTFAGAGRVATPGQSIEAPHPFPDTLPYAPLPSGCSSGSFTSFNKMVNLRVSLSSVSHSSNHT